MYKRFFAIPLLLMLIFSCKKEDPLICCVIVDLNMRIAVQSFSKLDLLDPQLNKFNNDNIDVYDKTESGYIRVFNHNMDMPKRFRLSKNLIHGKYEMNLVLNPITIDGVSETLVKFGDNVPDTIRSVIVKKRGSTIVSNVTIKSSTFKPTEVYTFIKD